ncbi:hypothetical protein [Pseudoalteromonas sp. R3]|uniref:hypothetical protein n=1 Tax=Pseudoalteromonas sp. R3 TaxID=1709477 RepID=UPI0006B50799|nr:hypothetical protein [Pseudoalteromonas sp. R3]AZZ99473.1 hypothetical protein ELR70_21780 [Pseudoalteromonas sp. R3]
MHAAQAQLLGVMPLKLKSAFDPNPQSAMPASAPVEHKPLSLNEQLQQDLCRAANVGELRVVKGDAVNWACNGQQAQLIVPDAQLTGEQKRILWQRIWSAQS